MRGSAVFRTGVAPGGALAGPWVQNSLWTRARAVPSLDLRFADNKSLVDAVTGASLVTFTRASSGTFVGSDGVLRSAVTNLVLQSEDFGTTWTPFRASVSANTTAAPNGSMTADKIVEDTTATNSHGVQQLSLSFTSGTSYTFSVYVKAAERANIRIALPATAFTLALVAQFNLTLATTTALTAGATATISALPDGWYRCAVTAIATATATGGVSVSMGETSASTTINYTGNGTSGLFVWGAQLEQASTVGEYIPTTSAINSAPRFDHNPTTGESLGLLVEEARTNLQLRSEEFDNTGTWSRTGLSTVTANTAVAPDGSTTADALVEDASTSNHRVFSTTSSLAASTSYFLSVYVKASTRTIVRVEVRDSVGAFAAQDFNLITQAITSAGSGTGAITALGNGWFRCTVTGTTSVSGGVGVVLVYSMQVVGNAAYTGTNGTSAILLWGAQLEAGAFPTSYIPTTTATVTRAADVASIGSSAFSGWYRQDEGTMFVQGSTSASTANPILFQVEDGTVNERMQIRRIGASNIASSIVTDGGVNQGGPTVAGFNADTIGKVGFSYALNNLQLAFNGALGTADTSATLPTVDRAFIGSASSPVYANGHISRITYWPQALPSRLQALTQ